MRSYYYPNVSPPELASVPTEAEIILEERRGTSHHLFLSDLMGTFVPNGSH
jgi:hypothetical protein